MGKRKANPNLSKQQEASVFYEAQKIVAKQINPEGVCLYRVRWRGYAESDDTWQPIQHLKNVLHLVKKFNQRQRTKGKWIKKGVKNKKQWLSSDLPSQKRCQKIQEIPDLQTCIIIENEQMRISGLNNMKVHRKEQESLDKQKHEEQYYSVDKIVGRRKKGGRIFYRIRWVGYLPTEDTWEPAQNLKDLQKMIDEFNQPKGKRARKMKRRVKYYEVEKVVDRRERRSAVEYLIRWKGFSQDEDTWQPLSHLRGISKLVEKFNKGSKLVEDRPETHGHSTLPREDILMELNQTDNYEIGGPCSGPVSEEGSPNEVGERQMFPLIGQINEESNEFIPIDLNENQLVEPDFM